MEISAESKRLLTIKEAAGLLRITPYTLREWVRLKKIRAVRSGERIIRIESEALNQWIRLHTFLRKGV